MQALKDSVAQVRGRALSDLEPGPERQVRARPGAGCGLRPDAARSVLPRSRPVRRRRRSRRRHRPVADGDGLRSRRRTPFFGLLNDTLTVDVEFSDPDGTLAPGAVRQAIENAAARPTPDSQDRLRRFPQAALVYRASSRVRSRDAITSWPPERERPRSRPRWTASTTRTRPSSARSSPATRSCKPPYDAYVVGYDPCRAKKRSNSADGDPARPACSGGNGSRRSRSVSAAANTDLGLHASLPRPCRAAPFPLHAAGHPTSPR